MEKICETHKSHYYCAEMKQTKKTESKSNREKKSQKAIEKKCQNTVE